MYAFVINYVLYDSIIICSIATLCGFAFVCIGALIKQGNYILSMILLFIVFINVYSGYTLISNIIIPEDRKYVELNDLKDFRNLDEIYFFQRDTFIMVKTQAALPKTRLLTPSRLDDLQDLDEKTLIIHKGSLGTATIGNRINLDGFDVRNDLTVVNKLTRDASKINLPMTMFRSNNGVFDENSVTSNSNSAYLLYGPYADFGPGSYTFTMQLNLLGFDEMQEELGFADMVSANGEHFKKVLLKEDFDDDGKLILSLELNTEEEIRNFELRVLNEQGVTIKISDISVEVQTEIIAD